MSELLVRAINQPRDPHWTDRTTASRQRRGHIMHAARNGSVWGRLESKAVWTAEGNDPALWPGTNWLIRVPSLALVHARKLLGPVSRPATGSDPEFFLTLPGERRPRDILLFKFPWRIDVQQLPARKRRDLRDNATTTLSLSVFRAVCDHNLTRNRFDENAIDGKGVVRTAIEQADPTHNG